jgi:hypothetical protein
MFAGLVSTDPSGIGWSSRFRRLSSALESGAYFGALTFATFYTTSLVNPILILSVSDKEPPNRWLLAAWLINIRMPRLLAGAAASPH